MQTWLVHMREPRQLSRDLGGAGMVAFQLIVGDNAHRTAAPCIHCGLMWEVSSWRWKEMVGSLRRTDALSRGGLRGIFDFGLYRLAGLSYHAVSKQDGRFTVYTPLHWLLLSLAAWREPAS